MVGTGENARLKAIAKSKIKPGIKCLFFVFICPHFRIWVRLCQYKNFIFSLCGVCILPVARIALFIILPNYKLYGKKYTQNYNRYSLSAFF